jgi:hypothetical protein
MALPAPALERTPSTLLRPVACGCALVAGAVYVAAVDPSEGGFLPCPFRTVTGLWCPGCGLTRATHHLLGGDLTTALRFNVFVVPVLLGIVIAWLSWTLGAAGRTTGWARRVPTWAYGALATLAVAFAVVRNLPGVDGLRG